MSILSIILQALLGLGFLMFGYQKLSSEEMKQGFRYFGYSDGFRIFTGIFEMVTAVILLAGFWFDALALVGGLMVVVTMLGAIMTHVKVGDKFKNMAMPIILMFIGTIITALNWAVIL